MCQINSWCRYLIPYYTGNVQTFTATSATTHKLQTWGAASGKDFHGGAIVNHNYGPGGYSVGNYAMTKNQSIYVSVGGKGQDGSLGSKTSGGWNGGGDGEWDHQDDESMGGGGGCTSIQTSKINDGQLKYYESVKNTAVLIVAGGGGGIRDANNGYGGGEKGSKVYFGNSSTYDNSRQATQTSGYAFGLGQSASIVTNNSEIPGAGGGWYGGYTVIPTTDNTYVNAGGGSGHIGTMLTNGQTIAGNQTFPKPGGGTETGHPGNGYCLITWMPVL